MSGSPLESVIYPFEGIQPDLDSPPIAARRALDLAGVRISIEAWRSLGLEERQRLTLAGALDAVDGERVFAAVRRASPQPQRGPQGQDPEALSPPEALVRALEPTRSIDARRWSKLRGLDRYALVHTYRRAVARSSFMILGEAFDAILSMSVPPAPRSAPASVPPGAFQAPGAYSNVKTQPAIPARSAPPPSYRPASLGRPNLGPPASQPPYEAAPVSQSRADRRTAPAPVLPEEAPISTHLSAAGEVHMVDVAGKPKTERRAVASAVVLMHPDTALRIARQEAPKGEVLATARIAGIMAAKRTPELIPLCHGVALTRVTLDIDVDVPGARVVVTATAEAFDRTGVEMEAMVAASVAGLTIYDMLKGTDREMVLSEVKLLEKSGGRSGHFQRKDPRQ